MGPLGCTVEVTRLADDRCVSPAAPDAENTTELQIHLSKNARYAVEWLLRVTFAHLALASARLSDRPLARDRDPRLHPLRGGAAMEQGRVPEAGDRAVADPNPAVASTPGVSRARYRASGPGSLSGSP